MAIRRKTIFFSSAFAYTFFTKSYLFKYKMFDATENWTEKEINPRNII